MTCTWQMLFVTNFLFPLAVLAAMLFFSSPSATFLHLPLQNRRLLLLQYSRFLPVNQLHPGLYILFRTQLDLYCLQFIFSKLIILSLFTLLEPQKDRTWLKVTSPNFLAVSFRPSVPLITFSYFICLSLQFFLQNWDQDILLFTVKN